MEKMTMKGVLWILALFAVMISVDACFRKAKASPPQPSPPKRNTKQVCSGNSKNRIRGSDCEGSGAWGASRGSRTHTGIDINCSGGSTIYAPISGTLSRGWPYANPTNKQRCINSGIKVTSGATTLGIFYVRPYTHLLGRRVTAGTAIGTHISVHCAYRTCMTDHVHFVKYVNGRKVNPTYEYGNI